MSYVALIAAVGACAAIGSAYVAGRSAGSAEAEARCKSAAELAAAAGQAAADAAAKQIAKIRVSHTTIRQEAEREIQTRVEYRDCRHAPEQLQRLNAALSGAAASAPADRGQLPTADAAGR